MKVLLIALISSLFMTSACRAQSQQAVNQSTHEASDQSTHQAFDQSNMPAEEYAIYAVAIGNMFAGDKGSSDSKAMSLVIEDQTNGYTFANGRYERSDLNKHFPDISKEAIDDYGVKNAKSYQLTKSPDLKLKYTLITKEKIERIFKSGLNGWDKFYRQFPNSRGIISFSRAGLNSQGDQALVYISRGCGGRCGSGNYLLLVKKNGEWIVQQKFMVWV